MVYHDGYYYYKKIIVFAGYAFLLHIMIVMKILFYFCIVPLIVVSGVLYY